MIKPCPSGGRSRSLGAFVVAVIGCSIPVLLLLVGVGSLVLHFSINTPTSPYKVEFSNEDKACDVDNSDDYLILDQGTGEALKCGVLPEFGDSDSPVARGAFSAEEVGRVTELSKDLASPGRLSEADQQAVEGLVAKISRGHGYDKMSPTTLEQVSWKVGLYCLLTVVVGVVGIGLWASSSRPPGGA